jgi:glutamate synthase (NADPH/NADH) small chain
MYGIPNMKLDKRCIERRTNLMKASGIKFVLNTEVGKDIDSRELVDDYDAVVLCAGAAKPRELDVEDKDLKGIYYAADFLKANTKSLLDSNLEDGRCISASGKDVIVIGGGDTGTDCVATSIRHGCKSVYQFEIMPEPPGKRMQNSNPWPEWPRRLKVDYGQEEAISLYGQDPRKYLISTKKIVGNKYGEVKEVCTVQIEWVNDSSGKIAAREIPGSAKVWTADLVLIAMGFMGPEDTIPGELQLERDANSNVSAEYGVFKTNVDKVFTVEI